MGHNVTKLYLRKARVFGETAEYPKTYVDNTLLATKQASLEHSTHRINMNKKNTVSPTQAGNRKTNTL